MGAVPVSAWVGLGLLALLAVEPDSVPSGPAEIVDAPHEGVFVYLASGSPVVLEASPLYAAALDTSETGHRGPRTPPDGLELDPRGNRNDLIDRGLTLFRVPSTHAPRGLDTEPPPDAWQAALASSLPVQPVFEHGAALRIPSDEIVVGFDPATTRGDARRLLAGIWDDLDASLLRELRPGTFVCVLRNAAVGRAFEASRALTEVDGVLWAEPSFINVFLETPGGPPRGATVSVVPGAMTHQQKLQSKYVNRMLPSFDRDPQGNLWRVAIDGHFEFDIDQWIVARDEGSNRALPEVVKDRTHTGERAVHMSRKGLAGNEPPDPYADGDSSYLMSPIFGLGGYHEVFVEMWFWARLEDPAGVPRRVYDFGRVMLWDVDAAEYVLEYPIVPVGATGDLTRGAEAQGGWRKLMFRVPVQKLERPLQLRVQFYSDGTGGAEGLYVDDIRVLHGLGAPDARWQYSLWPRGQIASRPAPDDPAVEGAAAWSVGPVRQEPVVALLDDGVEAGHPDLAFWEPEVEKNDDGEEIPVNLPPGDPVDPADRHGTACAGVLGAVADNGVGIAGVAPGARLLPLHRGVDDLSIVRAIDDAVALGARVLVIPWGWSGAAPEVVTRAILDAIDAGTTVVAAAGDGVHRPYSDAVDYPCRLGVSTSLICVGASGIAGEPKGWATEDGLYWWKSAGDETGPDVLAPGTWLRATDRRGTLGYNDGSQDVLSDWTDEFGGTGASACYVGGVAALMAARDPQMRPGQLKRSIVETASETLLVNPVAAAVAAVLSAAARERGD